MRKRKQRGKKMRERGQMRKNEKKKIGKKVARSYTLVRTSTPIEAISGGSHSSATAAVTSFKEKFLKSNIEFIATSINSFGRE